MMPSMGDGSTDGNKACGMCRGPFLISGKHDEMNDVSHGCKHWGHVVYYPLDNRVAGWVLASIFYGMGVML